MENPRFLSLIVEGEMWKEVYKPLFGKYLNELMRSHSLEELEEKFQKIEAKAAKFEALRLLSARSRFSGEIRRKLEEKGISASCIENTIAECVRLGYLDDAEQTRLLVLREQEKGYGPRRIALKMKTRKAAVDPSMAAEILHGMKKNQESGLQILLEKRFKKFSLKDPKERQKVIRALLRKGFDLSSILKALQRV